MKLLTYKGKDFEYTYYLNKNGNRMFHGVYKAYHPNGQLWALSYWCHGKWHGEHKLWDHTGVISQHVFYINDEPLPYVEMTEQEKLLFQIQHPGFQFLDDV